MCQNTGNHISESFKFQFFCEGACSQTSQGGLGTVYAGIVQFRSNTFYIF